MEPMPPVDVSHPITRHLWPLGPNAPYEQRMDAVVAAFNEVHQEELSLPLAADDARRVGRWLREEERNAPKTADGYFTSLLHLRTPYNLPLVHPELSSKINWLEQAPCLTCVMDESAKPGPMSFPIQAKPFSAQSLKGDRLKRLKAAINADLAQRSYPGFEEPTFSKGRFCVNVVSVVPERVHVMDADNLLKGLLDAMSGIVYKDDRQIQHVSSHRVEHGGEIAFYGIVITPVLDVRSDVVDRDLRLVFASGSVIDID